MREKGMPEGFLQDLRGDPGRKYQSSNSVAYEPLTNYLDVSMKASASSSEPPSSGFGGGLLFSRLPAGSSIVGGLSPSPVSGGEAALGMGRSLGVFEAWLQGLGDAGGHRQEAAHLTLS